ncbi:malonic semialdehyde reductase [Lentzea sp. NPDC004789]
MANLAIDSAAQDILFREAHSAHRFTDEPVSDEAIKTIYDLIKYAPTSMNMQALRVVLVRSDDARERLVRQMIDTNKEKTATAPLVAIVAADLDFHEELPRLFPHFPQAKDIFFAQRDDRVPHAVSSATLQLGYFIVGVRAAGLGAGPMAGFDVEGVNKEFFGDGKHHAVCVMVIGNPAEDAYYPRLPRLDYDEVFTTV